MCEICIAGIEKVFPTMRGRHRLQHRFHFSLASGLIAQRLNGTVNACLGRGAHRKVKVRSAAIEHIDQQCIQIYHIVLSPKF